MGTCILETYIRCIRMDAHERRRGVKIMTRGEIKAENKYCMDQ